MTTTRIRQKTQSRFHQLITEDWSGELFLDCLFPAKGARRQPLALCLLFRAYCTRAHFSAEAVPQRVDIQSQSNVNRKVQKSSMTSWPFAVRQSETILAQSFEAQAAQFDAWRLKTAGPHGERSCFNVENIFLCVILLLRLLLLVS